jgi:primary-amine oxidase
VVRDEGGARALYRGLWPNLLGNSLGWGLYFLFYGNLKELFQRRRKDGEQLGSAEFFSASIIAGALLSCCLLVWGGTFAESYLLQVFLPAPAQTPSGS